MIVKTGWWEQLITFPWNAASWENFIAGLSEELEVHFPVLRHRVKFLSLPRTDPIGSLESAKAYAKRIIKVSEMGSQTRFLLAYE